MIAEHLVVSKDISPAELSSMPLPRGVLVCSPDSFDVVDVKNPFMVGQQGKVNTRLAKPKFPLFLTPFSS